MSIHVVSSEKVTHLNRIPAGVCFGKDRAVAEASRNEPGSTYLTLTSFSGNVDCLRCKSYIKASRARRERMEALGQTQQNSN